MFKGNGGKGTVNKIIIIKKKNSYRGSGMYFRFRFLSHKLDVPDSVNV